MRRLLPHYTTEKKLRGSIAGPLTYYVSNLGSYSNSGTTQAEPITPDRLFVLQQNFTGREQIFLKRGESYEIELTAKVSGTASSPFSLDAYGTGAMPKIIGSNSLSTAIWTQEGELWYTSMTTAPKWIFVNGQEAKWASTPFHAITAQSGNSATCSSLIGAYPQSPIGATVLIKEYKFRMSFPYKVESYDADTGRLILDTTIEAAGVGYGLLIMGQKQFINEEGEWAWDAATQRLYIKSLATPAGTDIRICTRDNGLYIDDGIHHVKVRNINFMHQRYNGVRFRESNNVTVEWCKFNDIRKNGIDARMKCHNLTIRNNDFLRMGFNGISGECGDNATVEYNTLDSIGMSPNYGWQEDRTFLRTGGAAIVASSNQENPFYPLGERNMKSSTVKHNKMSNLGYTGVQWYGSYHLLEYNRIDGFVKRFMDGGGFHNYSNPSYEVDCLDNIWRKNIISNGYGNAEGTPNSGESYTTGLYVDNWCVGFTVEDNVVYNVGWGGIYTNSGGRNTKARRNILVGMKFPVAYVFTDFASFGQPTPANDGHIVEHNVIVSRTPTMYGVAMGGYTSPDHPFVGGISNHNKYVAPYNTTGKVFGEGGSWLGGAVTGYTLAEWQAKVGAVEANGTFITNTKTFVDAATALQEMPLVLNETLEPVQYTIPTGFKTVDNETGTITIPDFSGVLLIKI